MCNVLDRLFTGAAEAAAYAVIGGEAAATPATPAGDMCDLQ